MTLPTAGTLKISDVRTELGEGGSVSLGQLSARTLASLPTGTISLSSFYGKSTSFNDVCSLLHFDSNATDVKGNVWSPVSGASVLATGKFGIATNLTSGQYFSTPSSTVFNFGTGNLTIECWFNMTSLSTDPWQVMMMRATPASWSTGWALFYQGTTNKIGFWLSGGTRILSDTVVSRNTWVHIAVVRVSGILSMYVGGVLQTQTYASTPIDTTDAIRIGGDAGSYSFIGSLDEVRVSKIAQYTSNFSPPSAPFPNS
jgi:hypothetical protein